MHIDISEPLIVFFLLRHLRRMLKMFAPNPDWEKILLRLMYVNLVLFGLEIAFSAGDYTIWFWHIVQLMIVAFVIKIPQFAAARGVVLGVVPLVAVFLIKDLTKLLFPEFFVKVEGYLDIASAVAITWMVAMIIKSQKQNKALTKEREARLKEEERHRFIEAQNMKLEEQVAIRTSELIQQKEELQNALFELQRTQTQLIQSEKMASLGELTAGIAHEIQNPLNFVNNFSEVSCELVDEIEVALQKNDAKEAAAIAGNIKENLQKITHHGKRADAIVKGMLQHSRSSSGKKEPTDMNALADEYLRLSYHGLRAKDKLFNASFTTHFDATIGIVQVIPQDMGRVLLNLFTNAFYSVAEKKKMLRQGYEPTVSVTTQKQNNNIVIIVKDNGIGIPQKVLDKIYQPFFTTKPTGQGTGLGLSMSYDIIKAHGGEIQVETKEGEGAEFIISIPSSA